MSKLDLQTVLVNETGASAYFGFLPPHGVELAAGGTFIFDGDLLAALSADSSGHGRQNLAGYIKALNDGDLTVQRSPLAVVYDDTATAPKVIGVDGGTVDDRDASYPAS